MRRNVNPESYFDLVLPKVLYFVFLLICMCVI